MRNILSCITVGVLVLFSASASASIRWVHLNKGNQVASTGLQYRIALERGAGLVTVQIRMAPSQKQLKYLWRIDLEVRSGKKLLMTAPLETTTDKQGNLVVQMTLHSDWMRKAKIHVRTGSPISETVYAIDVGSFQQITGPKPGMTPTQITAKAELAVTPDAEEVTDLHDAPLRLRLDGHGALSINRQSIALDALVARLRKEREANPTLQVVVVVPCAVGHEHVVDLMDIVKQANIAKTTIATPPCP